MSVVLAQSVQRLERPFPLDLRAIGFDWDGTLVQPDTTFVQEVAVATMLKLGYEHLCSSEIEAAFRTNTPFALLDPKRSILLHHLFFQEIDKLDRPLPKVIEAAPQALAQLKALGYSLGIGTARMQSQRFYQEVKATGLDKFFDAYVMRSDPYDLGSIKNSQLRRVFSELWTPVNNAIFIGDSLDDHSAAANTSIYSVGVLSGIASKNELLSAQYPPSAIIASIAELPDFIISQNAANYDLSALKIPERCTVLQLFPTQEATK